MSMKFIQIKTYVSDKIAMKWSLYLKQFVLKALIGKNWKKLWTINN